MAKGAINVQAENIFPIIKKFLYSDHEIFLRELVSNAVDATTKLKTLNRLGEHKGDIGDSRIEVSVDKSKKTITVSDQGIGMTEEEVQKYLNDVAFSGAEEFMKKYEGKTEGIIGHFGLGFYSAFMVADKVEVITKSFKEKGDAATKWECDGNPEYTIKKAKRKTRGTDIILHVASDSEEFLDDARISGILNKYCKFLPVEIKFGTKDEYVDNKDGKKDKDGNIEKDKITVDNIINNPSPAWTKAPVDLKDEDYKNFYREMYPMTFEEPLFHIHLNVDYPFNLTGILYFPKLKEKFEPNKNKIQLYSNQVFITDSVENIVPEFLTLLHGVIDSPDIPLNVSRSYLQADGNVKKISGHITKKVADKLVEMYKNDKDDYISKWDDIRIFIEYGMLTDEKFYDRIKDVYLVKNSKGEYATIEEYKEKVKEKQTDKNENVVFLYANNLDEQHAYIDAANSKGYEVLHLDGPLISHLLQQLEMKNEKLKFARVDSDVVEKLIEKDEVLASTLSEDQEKELREVLENTVDKAKYTIVFEGLNEKDKPMMITQNEFMRRMKEQSETGGGGMMMGNLPESYNLVVNSNHPLVSKILVEQDADKKKALTSQATDLALLSQGLLKGEALTNFINRSVELID